MFFFWIHLYESRKKPTAIGKIQLTELIFTIILNSLSYCFSTVYIPRFEWSNEQLENFPLNNLTQN